MKKIINLPLILASKSPRRKTLLEQAGFEFEIKSAEVDETTPLNMPAKDVPPFLAEKKARPFEDAAIHAVVVAADTIVLLDDEMLGKPEEPTVAEAARMLKKLSGRQHVVITGVCILHKGVYHTFREITNVYFRTLGDDEISAYSEKFKPFDKAGAYGIQEWIGLIGVSRIEGDYNNVVGLPVCRLVQELRNLNL